MELTKIMYPKFQLLELNFEPLRSSLIFASKSNQFGRSIFYRHIYIYLVDIKGEIKKVFLIKNLF